MKKRSSFLLFSKYFLWFIAYSFIGWFFETIVCSIIAGRLVERGFLNSPICPIYGVGALICIMLLDNRIKNVFVLFFSGMIVTTIVEYIAALLLESIFHKRWWNYSRYRFHFQGRISLVGSVAFGILTVLLIKFMHPFIRKLINRFPKWLQISLAAFIFTGLIVNCKRS